VPTIRHVLAHFDLEIFGYRLPLILLFEPKIIGSAVSTEFVEIQDSQIRPLDPRANAYALPSLTQL